MNSYMQEYSASLKSASTLRGSEAFSEIQTLAAKYWGGEEQAKTLKPPASDCPDCRGSGLTCPDFLRGVQILAAAGSDRVVGQMDDYILCDCVLAKSA